MTVSFSIIMPVYNVQKFVRSAVDSVLNQKYQNWELIIVNDGSTDSSMDQLWDISDTRIKKMTTVNQGLSAARNYGLRYAQGEFIYFMDSDDLLSPDALNIFYKTLTTSRTELISIPYEIFSDNIAFSQEAPNEVLNENILFGVDAVKALLLNKVPQMAWSYVVSRKVFQSAGITFSEGRLFEDNNTALKLFNVVNGVTVIKTTVPLYYYRQRQDSIMGKNRDCLSVKQFNDELFMLNDCLTYLNNNSNIENKWVKHWELRKILGILLKYASLRKSIEAQWKQLDARLKTAYLIVRNDVTFKERIKMLLVKRITLLGRFA